MERYSDLDQQAEVDVETELDQGPNLERINSVQRCGSGSGPPTVWMGPTDLWDVIKQFIRTQNEGEELLIRLQQFLFS